MIHKKGRLRGDKVKYKDGVAYCFWYPFEQEGPDEDAGVCFDIAGEDFEDLMSLLNTLRIAEATPIKDEDAQD